LKFYGSLPRGREGVRRPNGLLHRERRSTVVRKGYYLHPTISGDTIVFASDEDLWSVPVRGGTARRLTRSSGIATRPRLSPDGSRVAYVGVEEGYPEVYVMDSDGGEGTRLTRLSAATLVLGWTPDGKKVIYATIGGRSNRRLFDVYAVDGSGGAAERVPVGPAVALDYGPDGSVVIGRGSGLDPSWWKRYRGGRIGEIWIDRAGGGEFEKLVETGGNLAAPLWCGDRIYFHSDHEGVGNLYSTTISGNDLRRHTNHRDFYLRSPSGDAKSIVYSAGGDVYCFDTGKDRTSIVEIDFPSQRSKRARKFVSPSRFFESADIHPEGHTLCLTARGRPLVMSHWEGAVRQVGKTTNRIRYRLSRWLSDGRRVLTVSDEGGEESLEIYGEDGERTTRLDGLDIGRPVRLKVSPKNEEVLLSNHRGELILVDLEKKEARVIAKSRFGRIAGFDYSPDGRFAAFGFPESRKKTAVMLCELAKGTVTKVADPVLADVEPSFDLDGKYLYFLSYGGFDPVRDVLDFAYGFPRGIQLKLVTLQRDLPSPFVAIPKSPAGGPPAPGAGAGGTNSKGEENPGEVEKKDEEDSDEEATEIHLDSIEKRVVLFPVQAGDYTQIAGLAGGKVLYTAMPVQGLIGRSWLPSEPEAKGTLMCFDFDSGKEEPLAPGITRFELDPTRKVIALQAGGKLRVLPAGQKPAERTGGSTSAGQRSLWTPSRNGSRCSTRAGGFSGTITTLKTWAVAIGKRSIPGTLPWWRGFRPGANCPICSGRWGENWVRLTPMNSAVTTHPSPITPRDSSVPTSSGRMEPGESFTS
jgi:tricorn protease